MEDDLPNQNFKTKPNQENLPTGPVGLVGRYGLYLPTKPTKPNVPKMTKPNLPKHISQAYTIKTNLPMTDLTN